jgi:thiamine kinase-like enzyme
MQPKRDSLPLGSVLDALRRVPGLSGGDREAARISPLDGTSNLTFLVEMPCGELVVRLAQPGIGSYAKRGDEIAASRLAMHIGIGPKVLHAEADTGLLVCEFVRGARTPPPGEPIADVTLVSRMGGALRSLHRCGAALPGRYDVFAVIRKYAALLISMSRSPPIWPPEVAARLAETRVWLAQAARPIAPCHNDPVPQNFLDLGNRAMLIDWEYAGMNDPAFDLAYLSLEAELTPQLEGALLEAQGDPQRHGAVLPVFKFLICVMSAHWGRLHPPGGQWQSWTEKRAAQAAEFARAADLAEALR